MRSRSRLFCVAPWLEAVVRMDGAVMPCCRSELSFGKVDGESSLAWVWRSKAAQGFRRRIARGQFPSETCRACVQARKQSSLGKVLDPLIAQIWRDYERDAHEMNSGVMHAVSPFHQAVRAGNPARARKPARRLVRAIDQACRDADRPAALEKLRSIAVAVTDCAKGSPRPSVIAPMRQVSLVAVCNARCMHCVGTYTGEIQKGQVVAGARMKRIPPHALAAALAHLEDVSGFFLNGSEFFLYPEWAELLDRFEKQGIRIGIATNGMLLTDRTIEILTKSRAIRDINISFDGASASTVESIRRPVRFDKLCDRTRALIAAMDAEKRYDFPLSISMVLMRRNHQEAASLVKMAHRLSADFQIRPHVSFQVLDATNQKDYLIFRAREYTDIEDPLIRDFLQQAAILGESLGIATFYTYEGELADCLAARAKDR